MLEALIILEVDNKQTFPPKSESENESQTKSPAKTIRAKTRTRMMMMMYTALEERDGIQRRLLRGWREREREKKRGRKGEGESENDLRCVGSGKGGHPMGDDF